jgi:antitoxin ParD1/3/4
MLIAMPTRNVNLSPQQAKFITRTVDRGHFRNASEVVRAGLRLLDLQQREEQLKLAALRRLAKHAFDQIDRGDCEVLGPDGLDAFMETVDARVRASRKA